MPQDETPAVEVTPRPAAASASTATRAGRSERRRRPSRTADHEFLPGAIEIVGTPPSPAAVAIIWLICILFTAAIGWSYFGKVDIYAIARGKIEVTGRSKVVQPLAAGRVTAVVVQNGSAVKKGDTLIKLDSIETAADQKRLAGEVAATAAEVSRRKAAIAIARRNTEVLHQIEFVPGTSEFIRERERTVLAADLAQLNSRLQTLKAQSVQLVAARNRLRDSMAEREKLIALSDERVRMRKQLKDKGAGSRAQVIEAETQYETQLTSQVADKGRLNEVVANIEVTRRKIVETVAQFIADQSQKLAEAQRKHDQLQQELIKARAKNEQMLITSPTTGIVEQLSVTTVGQVVGAGQVLMTIVPRSAPIEVQALVLNKDIGFVRTNQSVVVKIDAFPFTRYGTIKGRVTNVSTDAVDVNEASNLYDASAAVKPHGVSTDLQRGSPVLVFPATISLATNSIDVDGKQVRLVPGMTVTVEIETGKRRIIEYVLSPLDEMASNAAHER